MLADLTTYSPGDFLLFGPEVYWRLFALQNATLWPLQLACIAFGLFLLAATAWPVRLRAEAPAGEGPRNGGSRLRSLGTRIGAGGLALLWLLVGWTFLRIRYAPVNWAMEYAVPVFAAEAVLLLAVGSVAGRLQAGSGWTVRRIAGIGLLGYAVLLHPLTAPLAGRPWSEAELFGLAPDPTAMATLGVLLSAAGRWLPLLCMAVPLVWCLVSAATLLTLGGWAGWVPLAAALLAGLAIATGGDGQAGRRRGTDS